MGYDFVVDIDKKVMRHIMPGTVNDVGLAISVTDEQVVHESTMGERLVMRVQINRHTLRYIVAAPLVDTYATGTCTRKSRAF